VALDDEVEAEFEDLVGGGGRVRMRERVPRRGELVEEAVGDRDVETGQLGGERLDRHRLTACTRRRRHIRDGKLARSRFFQKNRTLSEHLLRDRGLEHGLRSRNRGHHRPHRRRLCRQERRPNLLRLALGGVEEPGQDLGPVLRGEDLGELDEAREVEAPVAERLDEVRVLLDERRGRHPVVGRPLRQAELAGEEVEERAVAEVDPPALAIKRRERDEELREGVVLAEEEVGEADGVFARGVHERSVSRVSERSWNARIRPLARERDRASRTPPAFRERTRRGRRRCQRASPGGSASTGVILQ
jgi:hypothetical protein